MPYIKKVERECYEKAIDNLISEMEFYETKAGGLNYILTKLIHGYVKVNSLNYQTLNDIVGVLESAKAEFQRRVVNPYEDKKIDENGDL